MQMKDKKDMEKAIEKKKNYVYVEKLSNLANVNIKSKKHKTNWLKKEKEWLANRQNYQSRDKSNGPEEGII